MNVETLTLGDLATNCYLIWSDTSPAALLVDCAGSPEVILSAAARLGLQVKLIVITHAHFDHHERLAELKQRTGAPVAMHELDAPALGDAMRSGAAMFGYGQEETTADTILHEGDTVSIPGSDLTFRVLHTPGHSPGGICLEGYGALFCGDLLFAGGIGRIDLPLGDERAMIASLARAAARDPAMVVYPGHGPATTIGDELATNPWLSELL